LPKLKYKSTLLEKIKKINTDTSTTGRNEAASAISIMKNKANKHISCSEREEGNWRGLLAPELPI